MLNTFCISTTTSQYPLWVVTGVTPVIDDNNNPYYATTSCPAITVISESVVSNPAQDLFNGIILLFLCFGFMVWYFISRFRTS